MDTLREHLIAQIKTEIWAFDLWEAFIEQASSEYGGAQLRAIGERWLRHTLGCYVDWMDFMEGVETSRPSDFRDEKSKEFERLLSLASNADLNRVYSSTDGSRGWTSTTIIQHMISHGIYHRGQLRQLAESAGLSNWPETDFFRNNSTTD